MVRVTASGFGVVLFLATSFVNVLADEASFVDPFIGTSGTGHTFPAACVPFGMVQAGPDTGRFGWDHCSGYRYGDATVLGFSQTHLNGTGCPDLGDVSLLPIAGEKLRVESGEFKVGNGAGFGKTSEVAEPGYYAVTLEGGVKVEIAATEHCAIYRLAYSRSCAKVLIDLPAGLGTPLDVPWGVVSMREATVSDEGNSLVAGLFVRDGWTKGRKVAFAIEFSRPWICLDKLAQTGDGGPPRLVASFADLGDGGELMIKVALSSNDEDGAKGNLASEIPGWDFEAVRAAARVKWNEVLSRATIEGTDEQKKNWYTALYHLFIQPNNIADVGEKPFYSTLSTWDTFRAAHSLYTILAPEKAAEFVDSMLEQGRRTGYLPIWTLWGKENQCMIGTHSVPVIVDWFLKECGNVELWKYENMEAANGDDTNPVNPVNPVKKQKDYWPSAYAQIKDTLTKPHDGRIKERWDLLDKYGYYPFDEIKGESVSRTMECAYDDWCAGVMAERLGFAEDAAFFFRRTQNWRNVFDPSIGLVRGKDSKGNWREPYNPYLFGHGANSDNDFTEGNAFQYSWHVLQDAPGLISAMGGREAFVQKLDALFAEPEKVEGRDFVSDVTGLIGQYVHGNEPSHHVIYFYPQVGHPEKAAERIREVFDKFYLPKPDGLCGNDDCGQMSAWYLFSAMGFYPFNPCGGEYIIGAPQVACAKLKVESGEFKVVARNLSRENKYVKSVALNGKPITDWKIRHADIMSGGELVFEMTNASEHFVDCNTR